MLQAYCNVRQSPHHLYSLNNYISYFGFNLCKNSSKCHMNTEKNSLQQLRLRVRAPCISEDQLYSLIEM